MTDHVKDGLVPCPFCGQSAIVGESLDGRWYAICRVDKCAAIDTHFADEAGARAAWNTRATSEASLSVERMREAARAIVAHFESFERSPSTGELDPPLSGDDAVTIKVVDLRRLRSALNTTAEGGER